MIGVNPISKFKIDQNHLLSQHYRLITLDSTEHMGLASQRKGQKLE